MRSKLGKTSSYKVTVISFRIFNLSVASFFVSLLRNSRPCILDIKASLMLLNNEDIWVTFFSRALSIQAISATLGKLKYNTLYNYSNKRTNSITNRFLASSKHISRLDGSRPLFLFVGKLKCTWNFSLSGFASNAPWSSINFQMI